MARRTTVNFQNPVGDPEFSRSPIHGAELQRRLVDIVAQRCKRRRTAIDVGAHIGTWTVPLLDWFESVVAIEPEFENLTLLLLNLPAGRPWTIVNKAAGAAAGTCTMKMPYGGNSGCWQTEEGTDVDVVTIDSLGLDNVDLIKIDTEGTEGEILVGAMATLTKWRPAVFFEDNGLGRKRFGNDWVDPRPILASLGYLRAERVRKNELWLVR